MKECPEEGKCLISARKREILLADKHGWDFVQEYKKDDLAENSDDEKRIRRAVEIVAQQRETKRKARSRAFMNRSARVNASSVSRSLPHSGTSTSHSINTNPFFSRMCYHCGKPGHLWRNCPAIKNTSGGYQSNQPDSSHQYSLLEPVPLNLLDNEHCHISVDNSLVCLKEVRGEYVECNNQLSENLAGVQGRIAKSKN